MRRRFINLFWCWWRDSYCPEPLLFFPKLTPHTIISTSLCIICFNSLMNIKNFWNSIQIDKKIASSIPLGMAIGSLTGCFISISLHTNTIKLLLIMTLIISGIKILFYKTQVLKEGKISSIELFFLFLFSISGGMITSLTGLGGGIILVVILSFFSKKPINEIPFYSNLGMVASSFVGVLAYAYDEVYYFTNISPYFNPFQFGHVNFLISFCVFLGAALTSPLGIRLGLKYRGTTSKYLFSAFIFLMAIKFAKDLF